MSTYVYPEVRSQFNCELDPRIGLLPTLSGVGSIRITDVKIRKTTVLNTLSVYIRMSINSPPSSIPLLSHIPRNKLSVFANRFDGVPQSVLSHHRRRRFGAGGQCRAQYALERCRRV
jgi:hypothetical protein